MDEVWQSSMDLSFTQCIAKFLKENRTIQFKFVGNKNGTKKLPNETFQIKETART